MTTRRLIPDRAELNIARLGTKHSRAGVRFALPTIARLSDFNTIDRVALTFEW